MARHEKKDVFKQMKVPRYSIVSCQVDGSVKTALGVEGMLGLSIEEIQTTKDFTILGHISEARRLMGEALAPQVCDYVADLLDGGEEKYVLFGWHLSVLEIYERELAKYETVVLHGGKSPKARQKAIDDFISDPTVRVFIANIQAGGEGVDGLQHVAARCGLGEPDWVPSRNEQAVARLDRIGQQFQVTADVFVAPGSIAEKILVKSLEKMSVIHRVLDEKEK
jgi:SNF2 family DNA or RNA helicase